MCWLFILNISALHVILNSNIEIFPANDTKLKKRKPPLKRLEDSLKAWFQMRSQQQQKVMWLFTWQKFWPLDNIIGIKVIKERLIQRHIYKLSEFPATKNLLEFGYFFFFL